MDDMEWWILGQQCLHRCSDDREDGGECLAIELQTERYPWMSRIRTVKEWNTLRERLAIKGIVSRIKRASTEADEKGNVNVGDEPPRPILLSIQWSYCDYECIQYTLSETSRLYVRQRRRNKKVSRNDWTSHQRVGLDNTGQICVWDSEITMTYLLCEALKQPLNECPVLDGVSLSQYLASILRQVPNNNDQDSARVLRVLELGCGMAGLAGLALAKLRSHTHVVLTDGHANAVLNNRINLLLNEKDGHDNQDKNIAVGSSVECRTMLWNDNEYHRKEGKAENVSANDSVHPLFDLVLISDCLHFQEYHHDLIQTLCNCTRINGHVVLCQPTRSQSLRNFVNLLDDGCSRTSHTWEIMEDFPVPPELEQQHTLSLSNPLYDPDRHQARFIVLKKKLH